MKLPYILLKPLLMGSSPWHDFTTSDNPSDLYSCPGPSPQINCTSHLWEEGWPRAMLYPWCKSGEPNLAPALPITFTSATQPAAQPAAPGLAPLELLVPAQCIQPPTHQRKSQPHCSFTSGRPRGLLSPGSSAATGQLFLLLLKTRCMEFQGLWGNSREQFVVKHMSRHTARWNLTQALVITRSPCSELWGEVPQRFFCLLLVPNLFSVTSVAKSVHHFSEISKTDDVKCLWGCSLSTWGRYGHWQLPHL